MAALSARKGTRRRTMNEINMVPFIDVMLVLLIIFMVTAPMITPGVINAPTSGAAGEAPPVIAQVLVDKDGKLEWKVGNETRGTDLEQLGELAVQWQEEQIQQGRPPEQVAIVIVGDKAAHYEYVTGALDALHQAGAKRVAFLLNKK
ncbi:protein TolR [Corticibacter populi]|uniref:Protein TolR n=1 Tax=Corticibacter populi TaxID=1550736 RepID=A0A3M6QZX5_9BURK|nr:biopolymer transporter ExbD [Corticibacter populi]RMX08560.1 protein TolR [Corticibacter populi]RZS35880.1 cell division and transport-associated protein TolR [Corticibacter populi]